MRWLLVTTIGKNPGDEFIRIGVENLIKSVDSNPEFILLDKELPEHWGRKYNFDKAIWCGMPLFWSFENNKCWEIRWWNELKGWISKNKNNFMTGGAGSFCPWGNELKISDSNRMCIEASKIMDLSYRAYARDSIVPIITQSDIPYISCPAIFSVKSYDIHNTYNLCNIMPDGAHYREFGISEAKVWDEKKGEFAKLLISSDFIFMAHDQREECFAKSMGWTKIVRYDPKDRKCEDLLRYYSGSKKYFGNRIHGAIVSRGAGASVWSVGYDSRQEAVRLVGAKVSKPSEININEVKRWIESDICCVYNLKEEFERQREIVKDFMDS